MLFALGVIESSWCKDNLNNFICNSFFIKYCIPNKINNADRRTLTMLALLAPNVVIKLEMDTP